MMAVDPLEGAEPQRLAAVVGVAPAHAFLHRSDRSRRGSGAVHPRLRFTARLAPASSMARRGDLRPPPGRTRGRAPRPRSDTDRASRNPSWDRCRPDPAEARRSTRLRSSKICLQSSRASCRRLVNALPIDIRSLVWRFCSRRSRSLKDFRKVRSSQLWTGTNAASSS